MALNHPGSACANLELLSAMIGGPKQIEIAEAIVAHFKGDLHLLLQASVLELVSIMALAKRPPRASSLRWLYYVAFRYWGVTCLRLTHGFICVHALVSKCKRFDQVVFLSSCRAER